MSAAIDPKPLATGYGPVAKILHWLIAAILVAAALAHHFVWKDDVLRRMLP